MKQSFFSRYAVLILMVVFFAAPFGMRGARLAVQRLRNDVKDWLPASFDETRELDWFREHFLGEQFIVASWDGCTGEKDDERFRVFVDKFFSEVPPSARHGSQADSDSRRTVGKQNESQSPNQPQSLDGWDEQLGLYVRKFRLDSEGEKPQSIGDRLGLYGVGNYFEDWGCRKEKWLRGDNEYWYYILPNGDLYRWQGGRTLIGSATVWLHRWMNPETTVSGQLVTRIGKQDGPWYYQDPRRLEAALFKTVVTGPAILHDLTQHSLADDVPEAKRRLQGILFGPDEKQTCLLITLTEAGKNDMRRAAGRGLLGKPRGKLLDLAEESGLYVPPKPSLLPPPLDWLLAAETSHRAPEIRLGGPAIDNVSIDEEGQITLVRLVGLSIVLGITLSWLSFRSVYVTLMVFIVGGLSAVVSLSIVWWSGSSVDAVLMSMPSLVYVLGISGAVHIINYYKDAVESQGLAGAPERALRIGWKPCMLAAVTTGLGLLSLTSSNILPIQKFGLFSAIGVVATLALLFTYLPAALELWPPGYHQGKGKGDVPSAPLMNRVVERFWCSIGHFAIRRHGWVTAGFLLLMSFFAAGLWKINTDIQLLKLFHSKSKIIQDYQWLEASLGNLVPMELVVRVDPSVMRVDQAETSGDTLPDSDAQAKFPLNFLERMEITSYVQSVIDQSFGSGGDGVVGQAMLAATFAPPLPGPVVDWRSTTQRGVFSRRLEANREALLESDYLRIERGTGAELWRVSLRLEALGDVDYGQFVNKLKSAVEPVMAAYHYREKILEAIAQQRNRREIRNARVYLLGASQVAQNSLQARETSVGTDGSDRAQGENLNALPADKQTTQFVGVLAILLKNAGVKTYAHDPAQPLPDNWSGALSSQDCVVLLQNDPKYDSDFLRKHARALVDARDHRFDQSSDASTAAGRKAPVSAVYTGIVPVVYKAQRTLLESLIRSTGWAFVMIAIVMIILLRSPSAGMVSMIPNIFPLVIVFGSMGWMNVVVDIGSMMTASVAMGVAVDDTIHFLTWFRRGLDEGRDRKAAIMLAYKRCATAMTQTTLIGGLGLSIFAFSTFTPTQRFGIMMLVLMVTALLGDLIMLPAILAGPLGRVFDRRRGKQGHQAPGPSPALDEHAGVARRVESAHRPSDSAEGKLGMLRRDTSHNATKR